ncbi:MAG: methyltransferase [Proteobacteria bacterium]|nr:methyltransferase [Pseudomonadota bacterium]
MTSKERVFAAITGKEFDVFPAITPTSVATIDAMKASKAFFPQAHTNPIEMADLAATGHELYGFDSVAPYFSVHLEAAALGAKVDFNNAYNTPIITKRLFTRIDDFELPKDFLQRKEFGSLLKTIEILKKRYNDKVPVIGKVIGPWTLAYNLYGVENLILDTILEPEKTRNLIEELSVVPITFAQAQFDAGADMITWAEHSTADLVSPIIYERYLLPVHTRAAKVLQQHGPLILHVCGNVMDRINLFANAGFALFHIDSRNDIRKAVQIIGNKMMLTGAVNNPVTLVQGQREVIRREVLQNLQDGIRLASPECALPTNVPARGLQALVETAHSVNDKTLEHHSMF